MRWLVAPVVLLAMGWTGVAVAWRSWAEHEWAEEADLGWLVDAANAYGGERER
jgi:hypothetical protein